MKRIKTMKKQILCIFLLALMTGCAEQIKIPASERDFSKISAEQAGEKTKTAFLLPLSGPNAVVGENFQNAALMAGLERPSESTEVLFFDTQGTPQGAVEA